MSKADPFKELLSLAAHTEIGEYRPVVGYLYTDGTVTKFSNDQMSWYSFDRAVSACFYSAAKRIKGTWDAAHHNRGRIKSFLMMVTNAEHKPVWKQKIDLPDYPKD